ncbi:MAG: YtxH domain-containing protein [Coriobacteriia bacterium]|jgi:gas vesicle protein|nr:YtxH domain-containing protein [Coriobacteriia bacterium]MDR2714600.1 YtxH domain-containing protein [Coriobacteriales bacterium]
MAKGFGLGSLIVGGAIGAALALLYAPRRGDETRAIVADKVDEIWGQGQEFYSQGYTKIQEGITAAQPVIDKVQEGIHAAQPVIAKKNDELREKIESARSVIADQVAKNAAAARDTINDKVPVASEKINQAVDVVKGQIDAAAKGAKGGKATKAKKD